MDSAWPRSCRGNRPSLRLGPHHSGPSTALLSDSSILILVLLPRSYHPFPSSQRGPKCSQRVVALRTLMAELWEKGCERRAPWSLALQGGVGCRGPSAAHSHIPHETRLESESCTPLLVSPSTPGVRRLQPHGPHHPGHLVPLRPQPHHGQVHGETAASVPVHHHGEWAEAASEKQDAARGVGRSACPHESVQKCRQTCININGISSRKSFPEGNATHSFPSLKQFPL